MTRVIFLALLSHWRRHPIQALTLLTGLALATALWSGVQAINAEARASYDRAAAAIGTGNLPRLTHPDGPIPLASYVALKRAGWRVAPIIEGTIDHGGRRFTMIGIDPLSFPLPGADPAGDAGTLIAFMAGDMVLTSPATKALLRGADLPKIRTDPGITGAQIMVDIAFAAERLAMGDSLSHILVMPAQPQDAPPIATIAPTLRLTQPEAQNDIGGLTESFHLNLTAFGFLSFAVGLFIVHGAIGLAFEQRRGILRTLRALGAPLRRIIVIMAAELLLLAVVAGTLGIALGYVIAALLLPDVAATLRGLYGADVDGSLSFRPEWAVSGILIAVLGTGVAAAQAMRSMWVMPLLATARPRAILRQSVSRLRWQGIAVVACFAIAAGTAIFARGLVAGFVMIAAVLFGAALMLPAILAGILGGVLILARRRGRSPVAHWFWADTGQQVPGMSLALMALLLALAASIGVGTMVSSFRLTFTDWLDQRLASELYVHADTAADAAAIRQFLTPRVDAVLPIWFAESKIAGQPGKIYGIVDHDTYRDNWAIAGAVTDPWDALAAGDGVLLNEQSAHRGGLSTGDMVALSDSLSLPLLGTFADYGNPHAHAMISLGLLQSAFPTHEARRFGVRIAPDRLPALRDALRAEFGLSGPQMVDQSRLKAMSMAVFDRTFTVTGALNLLTLAVAGIAILMSLLTLSSMRLPQVAPVWAMGLTRRRLALLDLLRSVILAALTLIVAIPLGLLLAWILLRVINLEAFGWRLPMFVFPIDWLRLFLLALVAAVAAAAIPVLRLARTPPSELLKVFSHER